MNTIMPVVRPALTRLLRLLFVASAVATCGPVAAAGFDIGRSASGMRIDAVVVESQSRNAPTVVLVGGLAGDDDSAAAVRAAVSSYARATNRPMRLLAVPVANPSVVEMEFPPTGIAYREQTESHTIWRWLGAQAPDLVLIAGADRAGLAAALAGHKAADMGRISARQWANSPDWVAQLGVISVSDAHQELMRRRARSPRQLATELAQFYGRDFDQPWYIDALALSARLQLGDLAAVRQLVEPYVDGSKNSLDRPNALVMAGHTIFTDLARQSSDPRYIAAVRKVADMGFDASGRMLEAMPLHDGYSDSVFMGTVIAAQAGALTGERKYFDLADRHLRFMQTLDLRPDGLYRHRPEADVPWGRGNGFAAIGLALTLTEMPRDHAGHAHALRSYRQLMQTLLPLQNRDGLWRNVLNHPGAFPEFSSTAMIGFALQRGLAKGWIKGRKYRQAVAQAWLAINSRTSSTGTFVDVCESTARLTTLEQYLQRTAILGKDPRAGAMALLFATELMRD